VIIILTLAGVQGDTDRPGRHGLQDNCDKTKSSPTKRHRRRCVERAVAYGPTAALDDWPRSGSEPTITAESKVDQRPAERPMNLVVRTNCGRPGFSPAMRVNMAGGEAWLSREGGPWHLAEYQPSQNPHTQKIGHSLCKILNEQEIKPHKVHYYLERRDPEFKQKMAELCVSIARSQLRIHRIS
jgi:hypothetical protein